MGRFIGGRIGSIITFNSSVAAPAVYDMNDQYRASRKGGWFSAGVAASGGTTNEPGNGFKYHTFTSSGSFVVSAGGEVELLLVAGGGGSAPSYNSGAGGGGVVYHEELTLTTKTHPITIGSGGANPNATGGDSTFNGHPEGTITAKGGGGGTNFGGPAGKDGGSGGGAEGVETNPAGEGIQPAQNPAYSPDPNFNQYGNDGGAGTTGGAYSAAGGGGAGGSAPPAGPGPGSGGVGGPGVAISGFEYPLVGLAPLTPQANSPSNNHYGAGGGGWGYSVQNSGNRPTGGGGRGGNSVPSPQSDGLDGLGGGAGNSYYNPGTNVGGDGVCIIRYAV